MGSGRLDAFEPPTPTGRRAEVLGRLAKSMAALAPDRRIVVAIDGVDGAGKTVLARELVELIRPAMRGTWAASACTSPRARRRSGPPGSSTTGTSHSRD